MGAVSQVGDIFPAEIFGLDPSLQSVTKPMDEENVIFIKFVAYHKDIEFTEAETDSNEQRL